MLGLWDTLGCVQGLAEYLETTSTRRILAADRRRAVPRAGERLAARRANPGAVGARELSDRAEAAGAMHLAPREGGQQ